MGTAAAAAAAAATPTIWRLCRHFSFPLFSPTHSPAIPRRLYHRSCLRRRKLQPSSPPPPPPPPCPPSAPSSRRAALGTNSSERSIRKLSSPAAATVASAGAPPELHLYNTMSKQKEAFRPREPGRVGMYVCGVTTYDLSHIGHARVYVTFDVLYRYLRHMGYEVSYVRNFTDVDDKEEGTDHHQRPYYLIAQRNMCIMWNMSGFRFHKSIM